MTFLGDQQSAYVASRARVHQVRRFCQALPSAAQYARRDEAPSSDKSSLPVGCPLSTSEGVDGALAALLRCVVYEVGAEIAMVSLLDDHMQYFMSGSDLRDLHDAEVTLDSTQWYGCESVTHHGGLCEYTITLDNTTGKGAFFEKLDLAQDESTRDLPFVNGTIATFRYYYGVPLSPYNGHNIGTLFFFRSEPSVTGLTAEKRTYVNQVSLHVTRHLERAVEALEGKRMLRFNQGIAKILGTSGVSQFPPAPDNVNPAGEGPLLSNQYPAHVLSVYQLATTLLCDIFGFSRVCIQELAAIQDIDSHSPDWNGSHLLAQHVTVTSSNRKQSVPLTLVHDLLEKFPSGSIFQLLHQHGEVIVTSGATEVHLASEDDLAIRLLQTFPATEQIVLVPLWDTHDERNIGAAIALIENCLKVSFGSSDLSTMSAFCATLMMQLRRLEVLDITKMKADFLGSISHELRTPLHGMLASIDLLSESLCTTEQSDLIETARYSGMSLLKTINQVLNYRDISIETQQPQGQSIPTDHEYQPALHSTQGKLKVSSEGTDSVGVAQACEEILQMQIRMISLKGTVGPDFHGRTESMPAEHSTLFPPGLPPDMQYLPLLLFDTNAGNWPFLVAVAGFRETFEQLLSNALKFTDSTGCVRVSLDINEIEVKLSVADTGRGMSPEFVRRHLSDAFDQESPLNEGTGLGFFLAKRETTLLNGSIYVESNTALGTTVTASFPLPWPKGAAECDAMRMVPSSMGKRLVELPPIAMSVMLPERWNTGDSDRGHRCSQALLATLRRGLSEWVRIDTSIRLPPDGQCHLVLTLEEDFDRAVQRSHETGYPTKFIVLVSGTKKATQKTSNGMYVSVRISGLVTSFDLQQAVASLFPGLIPDPGRPGEWGGTSSTENRKVLDDQQTGAKQIANKSRSVSTPPILNSIELRVPGLSFGGEASSADHDKKVPLVASNRESREPKILLVDDNLINLKVLQKYVAKCSKQSPICTDGGQAAIAMFQERFSQGSEPSEKFDIIFLDLSMPEVSGFDVAMSIRKTELSATSQFRTFICAITGLVDKKDRIAAFAAGVNQYLVKPTKLKDVHAVVENWRNGTLG
ncbi:hypothetical protein K431DRAFT_303502 [Polychaeton citri CBS 116435]|uniref:Sensor histidine kinase/response regulator n=1 Tax=Polychaeton citri CBS 116435 TaxID=1314669 RepID=A0A9P4QAU8_9PEZI|nr:hypothetical protein K431DRAFT_303502 [Polychaeton citri CBS 116435]